VRSVAAVVCCAAAAALGQGSVYKFAPGETLTYELEAMTRGDGEKSGPEAQRVRMTVVVRTIDVDAPSETARREVRLDGLALIHT
jgi:hypothetical protein